MRSCIIKAASSFLYVSICLFLFVLSYAPANATNPQVLPGGSVTLTPTSYASPQYNWTIYNSASYTTPIAYYGTNTNGWNVSDTISVVNGVASISSITVTVPSTATPATNYKVVVGGPGSYDAALFDVISNTPYMLNYVSSNTMSLSR